MFYEPEQDSRLMVECIQNLRYAHVKKALDVGVGSGILSQTILKTYSDVAVVGIDINDVALSHSQKTIQGNFEARKSDLFEEVDESFDLIVCNPPYLPQHKLDEMNDMYTRALVSGPKGYEYIERFLAESVGHLNKGGHILLLFSNLSNKEHIDFMLLNSMFVFREVEKQNVGLMEDLYVYELKLPDVYYDLQNPVFLSRGRRGMIIKGELNGKLVCAKIPLDEKMRVAMIHKESDFLQRANKLAIGPSYVSHDSECVLMEFIEGQTWKHWVKTASGKDKEHVLAQVEQQCKKLDEAGITKQEMTNPVKHIIISKEKKATLVDFERALLSDKPKNLAQFGTFANKVTTK